MRRAAQDVTGTILEEMLRDAAQDMLNRAKVRIEASGGHFELFVKLSLKRRLSAIGTYFLIQNSLTTYQIIPL